MKAVLIKEYGSPEQLYMDDVIEPSLKAHHIKVQIMAAGLNRADTLQRMGHYPPPPGASDILGLEMAGEVIEIGPHTSKWKVGDKVFGLVGGGAYAERCVIHEDMVMSMPSQLSYIEAAGIPEVFLTSYQSLVYLAGLRTSETILIHAGGSGVGTAAIQLAKSIGAEQIIVTASKKKHDKCKALGADLTIDYVQQNFGKVVSDATHENGVDVIIDFLGASYFQRNIDCLHLDGRMVMLAFMGGVQLEHLNMANILKKRITVIGSTLRSRSRDYKIELTNDFWMFARDKFLDGTLIPVIDSSYSWHDVVDAHRHMEANKNIGKIILTMD